MAHRQSVRLAILLSVLFLLMSTAHAQPASPEWPPENPESILSEVGCIACGCAEQMCYNCFSSSVTSSAQNHTSDSYRVSSPEPWMLAIHATPEPDRREPQFAGEEGHTPQAQYKEISKTQAWVDGTHNVGYRPDEPPSALLQSLEGCISEDPHEPSVEAQAGQEESLTNCPNFIDEVPQEILLEGPSDAIEDLMSAIRPNSKRQNTPAHNLMCGLYALEISFGGMFGAPQPTFADLVEIRKSERFEQLAIERLNSIQDGDAQRQLDADINKGSNLSLEALWIIVRIWGEKNGQNFNLGVCVFKDYTSDITKVIYSVYRLALNSRLANARTVWIVNDNAEFANEANLNHWSGIAPDRHLPAPCSPDNASIDPRILNSPGPPPASQEQSLFKVPVIYPTSSSSPPGKRSRQTSDFSTTGSSQSHSCDECDGKFPHASCLRRHKRNHNLKLKTNVCSKCEYRCLHPKDLRRHAAKHDENKTLLLCPICSSAFTRNDNRNRHVRSQHPKYNADEHGRRQ